jgi:GT2 family glycosyltransferase
VPPLVSVGIVTWNSGADIDACIESVRAQTYPAIELLVADNASADETRGRLEVLTRADERIDMESNRGFAAAHNALVARSRGEFYLCLNPDVVLDPAFVDTLLAALATRPRAGAATGKLLRRADPRIIDSTGIVMLPAQRHLDRGAEEIDAGQWDRPDLVFGASGAAALYRRSMLEDTRVLGEYFDEDFFAYREDADLAWRAQLLGWSCVYVPGARALHGRRVTPERRAAQTKDVNRYSVRNRFLLRLKNQTPALALRFLVPTLVRDVQVLGYVLLREWSSLPALADVVRLAPRALRKRRAVMSRRVTSSTELARWFRNTPPAERLATTTRPLG